MTNDLTHFDQRVRYVPMRVAHHGLRSGYDALFASSNLKPAHSRGAALLSKLIPDAVQWRLWALRAQPSQRRGLEAEIAAAPWLALGHGKICHFIYGEDTFFWSALWKRGTNAAIATFHYPPSLLAKRVNIGSLPFLDAVVIVGENQRAWFEQYVKPEKIYYCPHHVSTDFFQPEAIGEGDPHRLVCVGRLMRDYDFLLRVIRLLRSRGLTDVSLDIVSPPGLSQHPIASEPGVTLYSGVSDDELLKIYRRAAIGVLPLSDATANNALLEMMACGKPVLVSLVGGIHEYIEDSGSIGLSNTENDWYAAIEDLLENTNQRTLMATKNRQKAIANYSFQACSQRLKEIYEFTLKRLQDAHLTGI